MLNGHAVRKSLKNRHDPESNPFGYRVFTDRTRKEISIEELALMIGVSAQSIRNSERGLSVPTRDHVILYAEKLRGGQMLYLYLADRSRKLFAQKRKQHEPRFTLAKRRRKNQPRFKSARNQRKNP